MLRQKKRRRKKINKLKFEINKQVLKKYKRIDVWGFRVIMVLSRSPCFDPH